MKSFKQQDEQFVAHTYKRFPVELVSGKGSLCYDVTGKEYIDMGTGIAVNSLGFANEGWVAAVRTQIHCSTFIPNGTSLLAKPIRPNHMYGCLDSKHIFKNKYVSIIFFP